MKVQLLELLATMYPQQAGKQTGPAAWHPLAVPRWPGLLQSGAAPSAWFVKDSGGPGSLPTSGWGVNWPARCLCIYKTT